MPEITQSTETTPTEPTTPEPDGSINTRIPALFTTFLFLFAIGASIYKEFSPVQRFVDQHWHWLLLGFLVIVAALGTFPPIRRWLKSTTVSTRVALIVMCLGALTALVACVSLLPPKFQVTALRVVFIVPACLFPATLYYLFI